MSRIGNQPITLPQGVTCITDGNIVEVKGPKGTLSVTVNQSMKVTVEENTITVERPSDSKIDKSLHGTTRALIANMIQGVSEGYTKRLQMIGVGYRSQVQGKKIIVSAGYSQPKELTIPDGITAEVIKNTEIVITGIDKHLVGEFAANIRAIRKPEPYLGKGIRYVDEYVRRKEGKTAK